MCARASGGEDGRMDDEIKQVEALNMSSMCQILCYDVYFVCSLTESTVRRHQQISVVDSFYFLIFDFVFVFLGQLMMNVLAVLIFVAHL